MKSAYFMFHKKLVEIKCIQLSGSQQVPHVRCKTVTATVVRPKLHFGMFI
jgi:hypothetical protein